MYIVDGFLLTVDGRIESEINGVFIRKRIEI